MARREMASMTDLYEAPPGKQALRAWLRILTIAQMIQKEIRARFRREFQTTLPRFDVLAALARVPEGQTMGEISRWLLVSNGNITGIIARLAEDELVTRSRSPDDRRVHLVRLSRKGEAEFRRQSRAHEQWIHELLGDFEPDDAAALERLTRSVKARLSRRGSR